MKRLLILFLIISQIAEAQEHVAFLDVAASYNEVDESPYLNSIVMPFKMIEGMMLVEATMNNVQGNYIIDTGAPTLVINGQPTQSTTQGRGISQGLVTAEMKVQAFKWAGIERENLFAFQVDISHLEAVSGEKIAGIIGYDILKEVELLVDYSTQSIQLSATKRKGTYQKKPVTTIPFVMQEHLPVIKVKIGNKKLRLALDTASESNILDAGIYKKLSKATFKNTVKGELQGVDQQVKQVMISTISETIIKGLPFTDMKYLFTDLGHLKKESGLYIDGLLGYPFFKQGKMSINYQERKIYVWE